MSNPPSDDSRSEPVAYTQTRYFHCCIAIILGMLQTKCKHLPVECFSASIGCLTSVTRLELAETDTLGKTSVAIDTPSVAAFV